VPRQGSGSVSLCRYWKGPAMMWSLAVVGSELVPQSKPCGVSVPEDTTGHGGDRGIHEPEPIAGPCSGLSNPSVTCPVRALPCEGDGGWLGGCYESGHRKLAPMNGVCERAVDPLYGSEDCPFRDVCSTNCKSENTWYLRPTSWPTSCPRGRGPSGTAMLDTLGKPATFSRPHPTS